MRCNLTMRVALCLSITAALVVARPSPEAEGGYSYTPPNGGSRFNHQAPSWSPESRARASEVTIEEVPIRLVQQSSEISRPVSLPSPPNRGAYYFPSARQQQHPQQYYRAEHADQFNRGGFPSSPQNSYRNVMQQQPYRFSQQRGAYHFPSQRGFQPEYERGRNFRFNPTPNQYSTINNNYHAGGNNYRSNPPQNNHFQFNPTNNFNPTVNYPAPNYYNQQNPNQGNNYQNPGYNNNGHNNNNGYNNNNRQYPNPGNGNNFQGNPHGNNNPVNNHHNPANSNQNTPTNNKSYLPLTNPTQGYDYTTPSEDQTLTTTEASNTNATDFGPRITIAISKSTVIHTGKGSYKIDEKTGLPVPVPLIAEAHSYAGLPDPNEKKENGTESDNLAGEGTGNIPIIARGTPPESEENQNSVEEEQEEEAETEANTEEPVTDAPVEQPTTPAPTAAPQLPQSSLWPLQSYGGYHSHVIVAPGQTQYFALGTSKPAHQAYYYAPTATAPQYPVTTYAVQPAGVLQYAEPAQLPYAQQYGVYHPTGLARTEASPFAQYYPIIVRDPYVNTYGALTSPVLQYPEAASKTADAEVANNELPMDDPNVDVRQQEEDNQQQEEEQQQNGLPNRRTIEMGGVAVAGPGGVADGGFGGTQIVGPGGTAYSSPNGVSIVGPGGKVLLQGANSETILAKGPVIYYHKG